MSDSDDWNPRGVKKSKKSKKSAGTPKKAAKDPNAPKRPASAYILFVKEHRAVLIEEHPDAKQTELMQLAGKAWKELEPADKAKFEKLNAQDKIRYQKEMKNYKPPKHSLKVLYVENRINLYFSTKKLEKWKNWKNWKPKETRKL